MTGQPLVDRGVERFDAAGVQQVFAISPFGASETRAERLARWEAQGFYDPNCAACATIPAHPTLSPFQPSHRSKHRPHCTCDGCF